MQAASQGVNHAVKQSAPAETGQGAVGCERLVNVVNVHNDWVIVGVVFGGGLALDV